MSANFRAVAVVRELRALLRPALRAVRSLPFRLADQRREQPRPKTTAAPKKLFLDSALE